MTVAQELSIRQVEIFLAIGMSLVASLGGLARKMMTTVAETSDYAVDIGRKTFERALEAASSVGKDSARRAEHIAALRRDLGAPSERAASGTLEVAS